jgi:hypothetical protein
VDAVAALRTLVAGDPREDRRRDALSHGLEGAHGSILPEIRSLFAPGVEIQGQKSTEPRGGVS